MSCCGHLYEHLLPHILMVPTLFRSYLRHDFLKMAAENPDVEFIVRQVSGQRSAVVRGLYGEFRQL